MLHGRRQAGQVGERQGAPLEPFRHLIRRRPQLVRPQRLQQSGIGDDRADVRARPLIGARRVEVGTHGPDVNRPVRGRVHAVDVAERACRADGGRDSGHIRPGADDVAGRGDRDQPGPRREQPGVLPGRQLARGPVDLGPPDDRARPVGGLHPRPHVGVMVEPGHDHLVAWPPARCQRRRQPVGQGGHVGPEYHAIGPAAGQVGNGAPGLGRDLVGPPAGREGAARVADPGLLGGADRLDDRSGHLGACRAVEIGVAVSQRRVRRADGSHVKAHEQVIPSAGIPRISSQLPRPGGRPSIRETVKPSGRPSSCALIWPFCPLSAK